MDKDKLNTDNLVVGAFIEVGKGEGEGLWKIINVGRLTGADDNVFYRMIIDKNTDILGDEVIVEYFEDDPLFVTFYTLFDQFERKDASEWPPPDSITLGDDEEGDEGVIQYHNPDGKIVSTVIETGEKIEHYEYSDETETCFLQVWVEDDMVSMLIGYAMRARDINLI